MPWGSLAFHPTLPGCNAGEIATAFFLPFASLLVFRRRRSVGNAITSIRLLSALVITLAAGSLIVGCSDNSPFNAPATPSGTSNVVVTANSGTVTQTTTIALTVK